MRSPEHRGPRKEQEVFPQYAQAASYPDDTSSGAVYRQAQEAIFKTKHELSVYRFQLDGIWHVAVIGDTPPQDFAEKIQAMLNMGEQVTLPRDILRQLNERRKQATKQSTWVERHYRPGKRFRE